MPVVLLADLPVNRLRLPVARLVLPADLLRLLVVLRDRPADLLNVLVRAVRPADHLLRANRTRLRKVLVLVDRPADLLLVNRLRLLPLRKALVLNVVVVRPVNLPANRSERFVDRFVNRPAVVE